MGWYGMVPYHRPLLSCRSLPTSLSVRLMLCATTSFSTNRSCTTIFVLTLAFPTPTSFAFHPNQNATMKTTGLFLTILATVGAVSAFQPNNNFLSRVHQRATAPILRVPDQAWQSPLFVASPGADKDATEWTKKRIWNTATFRSAAILLALAGLTSSSSLPAHAAATVHLLAFATWFGSVAYTTFIAGITMFKNLPRQTFGKLQGKLFPKYFMLGSVTLILQLVTLPGVAVKAASTKALGLALAMTLLNQFYLEPASTDNMMRRYELEGLPGGQDSEEYKTLKANFGKFHGMSSLTNLIALCGGVAHAVYLAGSLMA